MEKIQTFTFLLLPLHFSATKHGSNEKLSKKPKLQTNLDNQQKEKERNKNTCCFVECVLGSQWMMPKLQQVQRLFYLVNYNTTVVRPIAYDRIDKHETSYQQKHTNL